MLLNIWQKPRIVRRFTGTVSTGGYNLSTYDDLTIYADVQTVQRNMDTGEDGDVSVQKLKAFSNSCFLTADENTGQRADLLWFQDKWYECRSSVLSDNTILSHWTSEFVQRSDQQEPPQGKPSGTNGGTL